MPKLTGIWGNSIVVPDNIVRRELPNWFHSINSDGILIEVSQSWATELGYNVAEMIGHRSTEFLSPESYDRAVNIELPQFKKVGYCKDVSYTFIRADGTECPVVMNAFSAAKNGKISQSFAFFHPAQAEIELNDMTLSLHMLLAELKGMPGNGGKAHAINVIAKILD